MRLLPTWEKSPFNAKRASEQVTDVNVPDETPEGQGHRVPPSDLSPLDQKWPVDLSRTIETNSRQNVTQRPTGEFSSYGNNSERTGPPLAPTLSPRLDLTFTAYPSLLDMLNGSGTMVDSHFPETHAGKTRGTEPPRQTSKSSSTSRSRRSASSSRQSRPSSRSSFDDQGTPIAPIKVSRFRGVEDESFKRYRQTTSSQDIDVAKTARSLPRPNSLPAAATLNKGSPAERTVEHSTELDEIVNGIRLLGSTRLPSSELSNSKRGARLGNLMMDGSNQQIPPPIRSSFMLSNLPAIRSRNSKSEKPEPVREIKASQQSAKQKEPPAEMAPEPTDQVLLGILQSLDSIKDLTSTAMVNKSFYRIFRLHERDLVSRLLHATSLPAWELRYIMQGEQKRGAFKLRSFQRDVATIRALHSFMLMKCQHICRPSTIDALLEVDTVRKAELDNALWRIWSFCRLFGKNKSHYDIKTQIMWLEGGSRHRKTSRVDILGVGNGRGLSVRELEDMSEMWRCLAALLEGFKGREADARKAGIFDNCVIDEHESATERYFLDVWIQELLCLGPKAVLTLNSCSFEQARVLGVTKWTPPARSQSRGEFFEVAVEEVYRERLVTEARLTAIEFEKQMRSRPRTTRAASDYSAMSPESHASSRELRIVTDQFQTMRTISQQASLSTGSPSLSSECTSVSPVSPSLTNNFTTMRPAVFSSLSMAATTASVKLGATLFPVQHQSTTRTHLPNEFDRIPTKEEILTKPDVLDPIDKAMGYLVKELGFPEFKAKQALAMSDDGQGINIHKAVDLLMIGSETQVEEQSPLIAELSGEPITSPITTLENDQGLGRSQVSASSKTEVTDSSVQSSGKGRRKSFRLGTNLDNDIVRDVRRETHIMNTMKAMCDPIQNISSAVMNSHHPLGDAVKHNVQTRNSTSKYTIAGRRHSHRPTLSTGSANFNPDELRLNSSVHPITPLSAQTSTRLPSSTRIAQTKDQVAIQKSYQSQAPPKLVTIRQTNAVTEKRPNRGWSIKEAFKKREESTDETIGCAL